VLKAAAEDQWQHAPGVENARLELRLGRLDMPPDLPRLQSELHHFRHRKLSFDDYMIPAASRKVPDLKFGLSCGRKSGDKPPLQRLTPALHRGDFDQPPVQGYAIRLIIPHAWQYAPCPSRWLPLPLIRRRPLCRNYRGAGSWLCENSTRICSASFRSAPIWPKPG
jgi:hypothetical protein